jgi:sialidase-1
MIGRIAALTLIGAGLVGAGQSPVTGPRSTEVFRAGDSGYHTYRIPSVVITKDGTLLAFAEGRRSSAADAGDIDLVLKRSADGGATWSGMQVIGDNGPNTFGNPCALVDSRTGRIWLLVTHNSGSDREKDIIAGTSAGSRTVWIMSSSDDGKSWSAPREITSSVKPAGWTWYATGPGVGIDTSTGRFVIPANHAEADGVHRSHLIFSDDRGETWKVGASADAGTNESQVAEGPAGRLILNMRNHPPRAENYRMVAASSDGGATLSPAVPDRALVEPPAQASLLRMTTSAAGSRSRLLFANPASTRRERMTVRLSYDEGATWPVAKVVHEGPAAYSSLVVLRDRSIGLLFERGTASPYEGITFAHFSLEWLTDSQDRLSTR